VNDRITRIHTKLAALPETGQATLGPPLTEQQLAAFEDDCGTRLPEEFRRFSLEIGHAGYGPAYGLLPMRRWVVAPTAGHQGVGREFPFRPDLDPAVTTEDRGGSAAPFPGAITVVHGGCSDYTLLVVTGAGRGRLVEVNSEGHFAPRFHADADFLAWYERWLDFVLTGHRDLTWFTEQMAGTETELVATLRTDPLATRRRAAAYTLVTYPTPGAPLPGVLAEAFSAEPNAIVRETILRALAAQGEAGRDLLPTALADPAPRVRSLAAILMSRGHRHGRSLSPHLRRALDDHLTREQDPSVRGTVTRMLDQTP
jgi:hypothetical protein